MEYRGYDIDLGFLREDTSLYTVEYCGDEVAFKTLLEAKKFIDEMIDGTEEKTKEMVIAQKEEQEREQEKKRIAKEKEEERKKKEKEHEKKIWTKEEIASLIQTNDIVLYRALRKLYDCQTAEEQASGETKENNGVGFNGVDAKFLTSLSEFLIQNGFLTDKQKFIARKMLVKYSGQLTKIANS